MNPKDRVRNLSLVKPFSEELLEKAEGLLRGTDVAPLEDFRQKLGAFVRAMEGRWMGKILDRLKSENQRMLRALYRRLVELDKDLAYRIEEVRKQDDLLRKMEHLAFPEMYGEEIHRDYLAWSMAPLNPSDELLAVLAEADVPR